jgi:hypothetical protein
MSFAAFAFGAVAAEIIFSDDDIVVGEGGVTFSVRLSRKGFCSPATEKVGKHFHNQSQRRRVPIFFQKFCTSSDKSNDNLT